MKVKDLSKLASVSVQTLHHYDKIGLLKPAMRQSNGYRSYLDKDVQKLNKILALKFFGFELRQIKAILEQEVPLVEQIYAQADFLEEQVKHLKKMHSSLKQMIKNADSDCSEKNKNEHIIRMIESFYYTSQLRKSKFGADLVCNINEFKNAPISEIDWARDGEKIGCAYEKFLDLYKANKSLDSKEIQSLVAQHYDWSTRFCSLNKDDYKKLGRLFNKNKKYASFYNKQAPGLAKFMNDAICFWADKNL